MSFLVSILIIAAYMAPAIYLFIALGKDFPNSSFYERLGDALCCLLWPICVIIALVIILGMIIETGVEQWRNRRG